MSDKAFNLQYRLNSFHVLPFSFSSGEKIPAGTRMFPSLKVNLDGVFSEFAVDAAIANTGKSDIGAHYFDTNPTGTLSPDSPFSTLQYQPRDSEDALRANLGIRSASLGYRLDDLQIRLGRHRYDITEMVRLLMTNAYVWQTNFTHIATPMDWLGGEIRYDQQRPAGALRRLLVSGSVMDGTKESNFGMAQGLVTFGH